LLQQSGIIQATKQINQQQQQQQQTKEAFQFDLVSALLCLFCFVLFAVACC